MTEVAAAALHLGPLHPFTAALVAAVAFGPFVVLVAVVLVLRRRDAAREGRERVDSQAYVAGPRPHR